MRNLFTLRPFALVAALIATALPASAKTLIHAGSLIDGRSDTVRRNVTVIVDGERIADVVDGFAAAAAGDAVVDLKSATVMPGLMDMHVHITGEQSPTSYTERFYLIRLMKEHGTYYVPTISAGRFVAEKSKIDGYFPAVVRPKAMTIGPLIQATFQRARQSGVKIAFGTDQGVAPHGENALEFVHMVETGYPPMKAIQSATLEAARLLGAEQDLGTIEKGKFADIAAVPAIRSPTSPS